MADVSIDSTSSAFNQRGMRSVVFTSALVGYWFLIDSDQSFGYKKTTDGGATWGATTQIDTDTTAQAFDVWFDQWTPGDTGTKVHLTWFDSTADDIYYRSFDTNGDTFGTRVTVAALVSAVSGRGLFSSITKTLSGYLYVAFDIDAGAERGFYRSTDAGANWSSVSGAFVESTIDQCFLFPASGTGDGNDVWAVYHDASTDELTLKEWDSSAGAANESASFMTLTENVTDTIGQYGFSATVRHSDGHLLVAAISERDTATADHRFFDITSYSTITEKTALATNIDDHYYPAVFIDQSSGDIYVAYNGKIDGSETLGTSTKVYYKKSTDGGATWGAETAYMEDAATDVYQVWTAPMGPRFYAGWFLVAGNDVVGNFNNSVTFGVTVALTGEDAAVAVGTVTPGLSFALTGVAADVAVGAATPTQALTGTAADVAVGTVAPSVTLAVTGVAADVAVGAATPTQALTGTAAEGVVGSVTVAGDASVALTGVAADVAVGTVVPSVTLEVTGAAADVAVGAVTPTQALAGVAAGAVVGTLVLSTTLAVTGTAADVAVGTVAPGVAPALTGAAADVAVGTVAPGVAPALTGVAADVAVGTVAPGVAPALTGVAAGTDVGTIGIDGDIARPISQVAGAGGIGSVLPAVGPSLLGAAATGAVGNVASVTITRALTGVAAAGAVGQPSARLPREQHSVNVFSKLPRYAAVNTTGERILPLHTSLVGQSRSPLSTRRDQHIFSTQ